jgi:hypothetical protein
VPVDNSSQALTAERLDHHDWLIGGAPTALRRRSQRPNQDC